MPELPEVEVTRLSLSDRLTGARVEGLRLGKALRWPLGCSAEQVLGARVDAVERMGKYLWLPLSGEAAPAGGLLWHLGM